MSINFDKVRVGQLVEVSEAYHYNYRDHLHFYKQPVRVVRKVFRKRKRGTWGVSKPHPMIEVRSIKYPKEVKLFYASRVYNPPNPKAIFARLNTATYSGSIKYLSAWVNAFEKEHPELAWIDMWLPLPPKVVYNPRRTSEEVQQDKAAKKWRRMILRKS